MKYRGWNLKTLLIFLVRAVWLPLLFLVCTVWSLLPLLFLLAWACDGSDNGGHTDPCPLELCYPVRELAPISIRTRHNILAQMFLQTAPQVSSSKPLRTFVMYLLLGCCISMFPRSADKIEIKPFEWEVLSFDVAGNWLWKQDAEASRNVEDSTVECTRWLL